MDRAVNPKVLLAVGAAVGFVLSVIAIFIAVSYEPDSGSTGISTSTSAPAPPARP